MKNPLFIIPALVMACTFTVAATSPAMAAQDSVIIDTAGYNMGSAAGYARLAQRINWAAHTVCGGLQGRNLRQMMLTRICRDAASADGMRQLNQLSGRGSVTVGASR